MVGYKHPCKYCNELIPSDSNTCPKCGKVNPLGSFRCPECRNPIKKSWKKCNNCGLSLRIKCPYCGEETFFGDYCDNCGERLLITCPECGEEQPPIGEKCLKCDASLKKVGDAN